MPRAPDPRRGGFTLLELLMAIAVFSVMSAMAYGGLASVLSVRQTLTRQADDLAALQMTFYHLEADVEQALDRSRREMGGLPPPSFSGGEGLDFFLAFTRSGWTNPGQVARSSLQRVAYTLEDQTIRRHHWQTLDGMLQESPHASVLLRGVLAVEIRFFDRANVWQPFWPPNLGATPSSTAGREPLPRAVEIIIEKKGWGRMRRLFEVVAQPS